MPPRKIETRDFPTIEGEVAASVVEAPVVEAPVVPDRPWLDMSTAPKDRTLVELKPGRTAVWRITRRRIDRGWRVVGFWADPVTHEEIIGEPEGWRMLEGYLTPGMVG